jgi:hypothetical protein
MPDAIHSPTVAPPFPHQVWGTYLAASQASNFPDC